MDIHWRRDNEMKLIKAELLNALEIVKPGLASRELIEQSTSFAFLGGRVVTYNDEISISHPVAGIDFEGAIKAEELYQLLNKTKKDEIELVAEENEVRIVAGRTKAGITFQTEVKLPLEELGEIDNWKAVPENFAAALKFVQFTCSKDMAGQPVLACVHIQKKGKDKGVIESCDNVRLTRYQIGKVPIESSVLIPVGNVKELLKYPITEMAEGNGWVHFRTKTETVFSCRVMSGDEYPNVDKSGILTVEGTDVEFPTSIGEILDRAAIFVNKDYVTGDNVQVTLHANKLKIRGQSEAGWLEETAKMVYEGPEITFMVPPLFLKDILDQTNKCVIGAEKLKFQGENWEYVAALS